MDGCDITIEAADVLMRFAIGPTGSNYWGDREYRMRPGNRHVDNICGVCFRNYTAGAQAKVTAALTGPALPRLGAIIPLAVGGVGDPIVSLAGYELDANDVNFGPFDVGDWTALFIYLKQIAGGGSLVNIHYQLDNGDQTTSSLSQAPAAFNPATLVCQNVGEEVVLELVGNALGTIIDLVVAPSGFDRQQVGAYFLCHQAARNINAGVTQNITARTFWGVAQTVFRGLSGGPYNVVLQALDQAGNVQAILVDQEATQGFTIEHPLAPASMNWQVTNTAGVAGTFNLDTVIKEPV